MIDDALRSGHRGPAGRLRPMREISWPHVVATALCITLFGWAAIALHSWEPRPLSPAELAAARLRALGACGGGMLDVAPRGATCPADDALSIDVQQPCTPDCEAYVFTFHDDGRVEMQVTEPAAERGDYYARMPRGEFHELANLVASLQFENRGSLVALGAGEGGVVISARCGRQVAFAANEGGAAGEAEGVAECLADVKQRADWNQR